MTYRQMAQAMGLTSAKGLRVDTSRARQKIRLMGFAYQAAKARLDEEVFPVAVERLAGMVKMGVPEAVFRVLEGRPGGLAGRKMEGGVDGRTTVPNLAITFTQVGSSPTVAMGAIVGAPRPEPLALPARGELADVGVPRGTTGGG